VETLETIARPRFGKADEAWLTDIRARRAGSRGAPYFTLVFPGVELNAQAFVKAVRTQVAGVAPIRFRLRSALVVPEPLVGRFHVFLIPDEGFAAILKLYDLLHADAFKAALRLDSPYLPHITVATVGDYPSARGLAQTLNHQSIDIHGQIDALEVEQRSGVEIRKVAEIPLAKAGWFG
jgi:2'-5' RNA ligase